MDVMKVRLKPTTIYLLWYLVIRESRNQRIIR